MLKAFNLNTSLRNYVLYVFSFPTPFLSNIPLYLKSPGFYVHLCNSVLVPYMLPYSTFLIIYEFSCYTCLTCGRILHALHVQVFHLPLTLCALMCHTLDSLVFHVPHLTLVPHAQPTLMHPMPYSSRASRLFCFWCFIYLSFFLTWTTVNNYAMQFLQKESY